jgi:hypothetical protein
MQRITGVYISPLALSVHEFEGVTLDVTSSVSRGSTIPSMITFEAVWWSLLLFSGFKSPLA